MKNYNAPRSVFTPGGKLLQVYPFSAAVCGPQFPRMPRRMSAGLGRPLRVVQ